MLAEKELQGHQQQRQNNTFTPWQFPAPAKAAPSSNVRAATPPSTGVVRGTIPSTSKGQDSSKSQTPPGVAAKAKTSTGRTSNISGSDDGAEEVLGTSATNNYKTLIVHRALSATVGVDDKCQHHNLFNMFLVVKDCRVHTIIDGDSCNNLLNVEVVKKLSLTTWEHPHPYHIQWFNNNGKVKVTKTARIPFSIGSYHHFADFDVVPMDACSLLLGHP
jgi:hypothetical protein